MNKIGHLTAAFTLMAIALAACSHIDEEERLIYVKMQTPKRTVLLEDFTGQRCVNCPTATEIIHQLQKEVGDSAVVPVAIHSGPLGFSGNATTIGLATPLGDEYYNHFEVEYQPAGLINRKGPMNHSIWIMEAMADMSLDTTVALQLEATRDGQEIHIAAKATGAVGSFMGKLQLWVTEDSITALQMMPDGTANANYIHNHVLRTAVNGTWGEDITLTEGETKTIEATQAIDPVWNPAHLNVVAFVYDEIEVRQATQKKVK